MGVAAATAATAAAAAASPAPGGGVASDSLVAFVGALPLEELDRTALLALLSREGATRVEHLRVLALDDLLAAGVKRVHAKLLLAALAAAKK